MQLRLSTIFYCAIIFGIASISCKASNTGDDGEIDLDAEVEGSGLENDLEGSASGAGEDDEDYTKAKVLSKPKANLPLPPEILQPIKNDEVTFDNEVQETTVLNGESIITSREEGHISSFFAQPGILAAIVGGALVGLLCAILVVMFIVYRMRKKDEGSYALDERKRSSTPILYGKGDGKELYA